MPTCSAKLEAYQQSAATRLESRSAPSRIGGYMLLSRTRTAGRSASSGDSPQSGRHCEVADRITETLGVMRAIGLDAEAHPELRATDFYTSHESLLLGFEQSMTRVDSTTGEYCVTASCWRG